MSWLKKVGGAITGGVKKGAQLIGKGAEIIKQHDIKFEKGESGYKLQVEKKQPLSQEQPTIPEQPTQTQPTNPNFTIVFLIIGSVVLAGLFFFFLFRRKQA